MKYNALHDAGRFSKLRRNRKRWQKVVSVMASIVVFCTTYALILPAITMEQPDTYCGLENHIHGPECYEKVLICDHAGDDVVEATPMANVTEGHTHDETCYEEIKNLICEQEEVVGHKHDSSCETLICSLEETSGHSHSDACYEIQYETKTWTEEVTVNDGEELTCTSTEEGHAHDGSCYTAKSHTETVEHTEQVEVGRVLTCTTPESAPHSHDASCYQMVCTQEEVEGHTHADECYTVEQGELICEIPEVTEAPETTEPEVTEPAEPAHEHSDACYEEKLICGCEIEHEHVADCYIEPPYEPANDEALVCELEEHKHDDACLIAETGELICDLEEHSHDENCYEQLPAFEMWLPLDADIDLDVYTEKHEYIDEDGLYGVTVYAKPDTFDVPVTLEVELLEEDDDRYVNALDVLAAQVEETEEAEEEIVDEAADELAAIDEVTPENTLPEEPAEPTSEAPVAEEEVVEDEVIEEEIIEEEVIEEEITAQPALTGEEGMIAFDIHFVDEDGDEVQPLEPVYVHIQAMGLLPEDVDLSTVTVQHIREEAPATWGRRLLDMLPFVDETVYIPEVVADMIDEDLGWIDFEPNMDDDEIYDVNAAFEVDGFSTFTITWSSSGWNSVNGELEDVEIYDVNGSPITVQNVRAPEAINSATYIDENFAPQIDGYKFVSAHIGAYNGARIYWLTYRNTSTSWNPNYQWQYSTNSNSNATSYNWQSIGSNKVYFVYKAIGQEISFNIEGVPAYEEKQYPTAVPFDTSSAIKEIAPGNTVAGFENYRFVEAYTTIDEEKLYVTDIKYSQTDGWSYLTEDAENWTVTGTVQPDITLVYESNVAELQLLHVYGTEAQAIEPVEITYNEWYTLEDLANTTNRYNYSFRRAQLNDENGKEMQAIMYNSTTEKWYYKAGGSVVEIGKDITAVYMYYGLKATPYDGMTPEGVTVHLFDYDPTTGGINLNKNFKFSTGATDNGGNAFGDATTERNYYWNEWTGEGGGVRQGIVKKNLSGGFPVLITGNTTSESLDYIFNTDSLDGGAMKNSAKVVYGDPNNNYHVDDLFQQDIHGYYYYDSHQEFAQYNYDDNTFDLYYVNHDPNDKDGMKFAPFDEYDETNAGDFNYYLGTHINGSFYMPKEGVVDGENMVFEFQGDDDVWVFIDDMLILDLGGIHKSFGGYIDFATGVVYIDVVNDGDGTGASHADEDVVVSLESLIKAAFAERNEDPTEWIAKNMVDSNRSVTINGVQHSYKTFVDYSEHELDFFYLERGAGDSNCMIKFNLPTIPKNSLMVGKNLDVIGNEHDEAPDDFTSFVKDSLTYEFKVLGADQKTVLEQIVGKEYTIQKNGVEVGSGKIGADGTFYLKADEIAVFPGVFSASDTITYYVQEIMPTTLRGQYQGVGYEVVGGGGTTEEKPTAESVPEGSSFTSFISNKLESQKQSTTVMFNNKLLFEELSVLKINKTVLGGTTRQRNSTFNVQVMSGPINGELLPMTEGTAYTVNNGTTTTTKYVGANGIIELKNNETATFLVLAGTEYTVEEMVPTSAAYEESYEVNGEPLDPDDVPEVKIDLVNSVHTVQINNQFPTTGLKVTKKVVNTSDTTNTDGSFTFKIGPLPETVVVTDVRFAFTPKQSTGEALPQFVTENGKTFIEVTLKHNQSVVIEGIEADAYTITETTTDGYSVKFSVDGNEANGNSVTATVAENKTTEVTCTNTTGYALPSTGGIGTTLYTMSGMAMMSAALVGGYGLRRKRERGSEE